MNTALFLMALSFVLGVCVASVLLDHEIDEPAEPTEAQAERGGGDEHREA